MKIRWMRGALVRWMALLSIMLFTVTAMTGWAAAREEEGELDALKEEMSGIRHEMSGIKRELGEIHAILQRALRTPGSRPQPKAAMVTVKGRPTLGRAEAPVTMVEFSDYQCPFCRRFVVATLPLLKKHYIDTGKLRYVFSDFPLDNIHPDATKAAEAAHCAGEQGRYWVMHDLLFQNARDLSVPSLNRHAQSLGLDSGEFGTCLESGRYLATIKSARAEGVKAGVRGTPTFFLGPSTSGDGIVGKPLVGARPFPAFKKLIDSLLEEAEKN